MSIRTATTSDAAQIADLVHSLAHCYLNNPVERLPQWFADTLRLSSFTRRLTGPDYINLIFEEEQKIVGYIALKGGSHLYHLFVSEAYQGRGIARKLWEEAQQASSHPSYTLRSSIYAVPVYRRFGFVESGPIGTKDGISYQPMELTQAHQ